MTAKTRIVEHLGEVAVLLPQLVREGLAANDRAKLRMAALQAALNQARNPVGGSIDLSAEAKAAGLDPVSVRRLVVEAHAVGRNLIHAPGAHDLYQALLTDVAAMLTAVEVGEVSAAPDLRRRFEALSAAPGIGATDEVDSDTVEAVTSASARGPDSLHRLVMDLHKALNQLAAATADEVVGGAHAFGLRKSDHALVEAFMRGVDATKPLKFDHPGLDALAARTGDKLVIQNDIGTTDAHVLVVAVERSQITVTYTDVHRARAKFFVGLLDELAGAWSGLRHDQAEGLAEGAAFHLVTGCFAVEKLEERARVLEAVGAALVFLIDWNKARKVLRLFVDKAAAVRILDWAARRRHGHRAFLELGGAELVHSAVRRIAAARIGYGTRLDAALGREGAVQFLEAALRLTSEGRLAGRADRLIRDAIDAELGRRLERSESELLQGVVRQAGLAREIAAGLGSAAGCRTRRAATAKPLAERAKRIEEKADRLALALRTDIARFGEAPATGALADAVENAIDALEDAAFLFSLVPEEVPGRALDAFRALVATAVKATSAVARGADAAAIVADGDRRDTDDAIEAVAALIDLEHEADAQERATIAAVLGEAGAAGPAIALLECARRVERATDHLAQAGHGLRAHVIGDLAS